MAIKYSDFGNSANKDMNRNIRYAINFHAGCFLVICSLYGKANFRKVIATKTNVAFEVASLFDLGQTTRMRGIKNYS